MYHLFAGSIDFDYSVGSKGMGTYRGVFDTFEDAYKAISSKDHWAQLAIIHNGMLNSVATLNKYVTRVSEDRRIVDVGWETSEGFKLIERRYERTDAFSAQRIAPVEQSPDGVLDTSLPTTFMSRITGQYVTAQWIESDPF